jgi:hypothetical protein
MLFEADTNLAFSTPISIADVTAWIWLQPVIFGNERVTPM